uniref:Putative WW-binding domain-containing protein n=1 Tax=Acanthochromis polyacanthus TaxID=80966 RepID=A0A3Q1EWP7_9TELE
ELQKEDQYANTDDCTYNSFQYWRVPLPELDLSLLEDTGDHSQSKEKLKTKDSSSDGKNNQEQPYFSNYCLLFYAKSLSYKPTLEQDFIDMCIMLKKLDM